MILELLARGRDNEQETSIFLSEIELGPLSPELAALFWTSCALNLDAFFYFCLFKFKMLPVFFWGGDITGIRALPRNFRNSFLFVYCYL
jgi:hypothetical protein